MTDHSDRGVSGHWAVLPQDVDPVETKEWLEALEASERATFILRKLLDHARACAWRISNSCRKTGPTRSFVYYRGRGIFRFMRDILLLAIHVLTTPRHTHSQRIEILRSTGVEPDSQP
jgi:tartrate dehydratase alpha subunit/fumarate hydratase class I-like protein